VRSRRQRVAPSPSPHTPRAYACTGSLGRAARMPEHKLFRPPRAASGEPHSPLELQANQPFQDLHLVTWKLPVPHIVELRPYSHQNPSFRGRAAIAPPPPLAGGISGRASAANRSLVSPIALLDRLFASPSLTFPPPSAPPPSGYGGEGRGHNCEPLKVGRGLRTK
jgi:hypothetical protein